MTSVPGIFACGNVLHVHDLVDYVSEESSYCGARAALYIKGDLKKGAEIPVQVGNLVRYVLPTKVQTGEKALLSLRCIAPAQNISLIIKTDSEELFTKKYKKIFPSEMQRIQLDNIPDNASHLEVFFRSEAG